MILRRPSAAALLAMAFLLAPAPLLRAQKAVTVAPPAPGKARDASLDDYRRHLTALSALVDACAQGRDSKTCDPELVGFDDRIPLSPAPNAERRLIRYGWLRVLIAKAEEADEPAARPAPPKTAAQPPDTDPADRPLVPHLVRPPKPTTTQLLQDAKRRLASDLAQIDGPAAARSSHPAEQDALNKILEGRDFRSLAEVSARDSALEKFGNWVNGLFEVATAMSARAPWIGRAIVWGFILAICIGLAWGLMQLEKRWRVRLVPEADGPSPGSASARDWQLWLKDAQAAAAAGLWREAIHFVYWASISRLESRRLWPADRARTPREYLALLPKDDPRRAGLATLTGSFERTWYGGRPAAEYDFRRAEKLAGDLIAGADLPGRSAAGGGAQ